MTRVASSSGSRCGGGKKSVLGGFYANFFCLRPNGRSRKAGTGRPPGWSYPPQATLMNAEVMYIIERKIAMMVGNKRTSEILSSCIQSPLAQLFDLYLL